MITKLKRHLHSLQDRRQRRWIVTTLTLGVALLAVLPAADEYRRWASRRAQLSSAVQSTQAMIQRLPRAEELLEQKRQRLVALQAQTTGEGDVQEFREEVVAMIRDSGCDLRRIRLTDPVSRAWKDGDRLLESTRTGRTVKSDYQLETRTLQLTISGEITNITALLARLHQCPKMDHTKQLTLRPSDPSGEKDVVLEVELLLFDLCSGKAAA